MTEGLTIPVERDLWFFNIGTIVPSKNTRRQWNACREYGFVSAGQTSRDVQYACRLKRDDIICAYESGTGYIAIGQVQEKAIPILQFRLDDGRTLHNLPYINMGDKFDKGLFENANDINKCEYVAKVKWFDTSYLPLWIPKGSYGYYAPRNTTADLKHKDDTIKVIEQHFKVKFAL